MKIKTFKIKAGSDEQTFDFSDFLGLNERIDQVTPTLIKEKNSYYWYVFVTYRYNYFIPYKEKEVNKDFEKEVYAIIDNKELNLSTRFKNIIKCSIENIPDYENVIDFKRMRNLGNVEFNRNHDTLLQILEIAKKYKAKGIMT